MREGGNMEEGQVVQALDVAYPLKFFEAGTTENWRSRARYSEEVEAASSEGQYKTHSLAQDQEDVWLYENWFYGMKGGVIMESGALNGLTFSTSYMFEVFANWTALHVEADPENYKNLRGNREQAVNVHAALCRYVYRASFTPFFSSLLDLSSYLNDLLTTSPLSETSYSGTVRQNYCTIAALESYQCVALSNL